MLLLLFFQLPVFLGHQVLKVASRFEILVNQRKALDEYKDMNELEILQNIAGRYNNYKATAALRKWQLSPDFINATAGIIFGVCSEACHELQSHLNHNKWSESGILAFLANHFGVWGWRLNLLTRFSGWICFRFMPAEGYSETLLRLKRHQLHESPKGLDAFWTKILTEPLMV